MSRIIQAFQQESQAELESESESQTVLESNQYDEKINQEILNQQIEYVQKKLRKAKIKYNNLIESCILISDYTIECYEMEIDMWTNQLVKLYNK